ncbi:MAG: photosystem reaction center subunit H [Methylobacteriaceae bacterium]
MRRPLACALFLLALTPSAQAACAVEDAGLEPAIAAKKELQEAKNAQVVRDLRTLRDAAIVLESYGFPKECKELVGILKELTANPDGTIKRGSDTDEEKAEEIQESREPKAGPKDPRAR